MMIKSFGLILILVTIPANSQLDNVLLETVKSTLSQKLLEFNTTTHQIRNNTDELCIYQLEEVVNSVAKLQNWALKMIDAWGKLPSGMMSGNSYALGNFDQCLSIEKSVTNAGTIKGQYCLTTVGIKLNRSEMNLENLFPAGLVNMVSRDALKQSSMMNISVAFNIGICIPSTCSAKFLQDIIETQYQSKINLPVAISIAEDSCYNNEPIVFNGADIFAIIFFSFIAFLMFASTIYDIFCIQMKKQRNNALIAFSVYTNCEQIFKLNRSKSINVMECLNGIRALSMIWVVFGHTYMTFIMSPTSNLMDLSKWLENPYSMIIVGASVAVDSFFLLSGLLVAWSMLRHLDKTNGRINIPLLYFHRYLRLTPALAANILFYSTLWKYLAVGPTNVVMKEANFCDTYWWSSLLYVQNYVNPTSICFGHSWYLSIDMQCFILSPLFIYPLWRWKNKFIWIIPIIICLSIGCVFSLFMIYGLVNTIDSLIGDAQELEAITYTPTHIRIGAWLIGVLLGYFLHNIRDKKINISALTVLFGWTISLTSISAIVFGIYTMNQEWHKATVLESAFHESLSRVSWAISLAWIIFACVKGYGGPVNWFLSLPMWQPISRLSYSLYLVHLTVLFGITGSTRSTLYFTDFNAIHKFWGDFAISFGSAIICSLAFESPVLILEKILLGHGSKSEKSLDKQIESSK